MGGGDRRTEGWPIKLQENTNALDGVSKSIVATPLTTTGYPTIRLLDSSDNTVCGGRPQLRDIVEISETEVPSVVAVSCKPQQSNQLILKHKKTKTNEGERASNQKSDWSGLPAE
jgi:hypothetical protein